MNIVFDLGNTLHKYAIFEQGEMIARHAVKKLTTEMAGAILQQYPSGNSIISSVDNHQQELEEYIRAHSNTIIFNHLTPLPVTNHYKTPETLGKDRIAAVVAASGMFPASDVLVIDAGTCIKYDFISSAGIYNGGAISPGLHMRFRAMHNYTARLPLITPEQLQTADIPVMTGDSTTNSLIAGGASGALMEAQGFIDHYEQKYPGLRVVLTGGDAPFFELHLKRRIFALPELVLFGLNIILEHNLKQN